MTGRYIDYELRDSVAWITLNRPDQFNALHLEAMRELFEIANRCSSDPAVRVAVLTGAGDKAFCAGGDVADFDVAPAEIAGRLKEMTAYFHMAISRFAWMNAPLIAMVNGVAAGAGLSLMAACDLAVAGDNARFTSAYTRLGFTPDGSSSYFLSRLIGTRRAAELYITNRTLTADEALDWGLVNRVVPAADLAGETAALAAGIADGPTRAFGGVKKLLLMATQDSLESQMERETRQIVEMAQSADGLEGVRAFLDRRKPAFTGA
ncbi:enoyl-CoA hydratase/isomerase family protein [Marinibaculum pumilum]|uniref:Enoyl-CoA hydratase/isomerase family protein n=1 Tax=Marinibaculum pumilum TaxID=1766165 RepID=A0ABV7LA36_9PROT